MLVPVLSEHVSGELHREVSIMKEKRKLKEERANTRTKGAGGDSRDLQSKLDKATAEIKRLQSAAGGKKGGGGKGAAAGE